jgi:hypothetical protein
VTQLKENVAINFGSIPTPFCKEVTTAFVGADTNDLVEVSASQALAAGVILAGGRVSATGVVAIMIATTGGATVTPNTVTVDIYVTKGDAGV